jgi:hypothetical protein
MIIELCNCTAVLLHEIMMKEIKQKDVACTYALALRSSENTDWQSVNQAIINRWSMAGLKRIKNMAWSGKCFT